MEHKDGTRAEKSHSPSPTRNNQEDEKEAEYLDKKRLVILMSSMLLIVICLTFDMAILATAIPRITDQFHTIKDIGWYGASYMITTAALQPLTGKFYTYFNLKKAYLAFIVIFEIGSVLCGVAQSSKWLVIARAVSGIGGSGLINGSMTIAGVAAPPEQRGMLLGVIVAMAGLGQIMGPIIGGVLTQHASWRWCFYINLPCGAVTVLVILLIRFPPNTAQKTDWDLRTLIRNFDITGFFIFAPACVMLLLALQWGGVEYDWDSATIIGLLCGSAGAFIAFTAWEIRQGDVAMIPPSLMRNRVVWTSCITSNLQGGGMLVIGYYLPLWFQTIQNATPTMSAVYTLATLVPQLLAAIFAGFAMRKFSYFLPYALLGNILLSISTGLMTTFGIHTTLAAWTGYQIIGGLGRGFGLQIPIQAVQTVTPKKQMATGTAVITWGQFFGGATFVALGQTAFANVLKHSLKHYAPGVDAQAVINAGATNVATVVSDPADLRGVDLAYNWAITRVYFIAVGCGIAGTISCWGLGRLQSPKKAKEPREENRDGKVKQEA